MDPRHPVGIVVAVGIILLVATMSTSLAGGQATPEQPVADNTITRVKVFPNASARWSIQVRTRLETPGEEDQYRRFQERLRTNESIVLDRFQNRMMRVVGAAANATGRVMTADEFTVSTHIQEVPRTWGVVSYEFTWGNFAVTENGSLVIGDVFEGGFFLAQGDRLVVESPEGFHLAEIEPPPETTSDGAVAWQGRRDFEDRHPRIRFDQNRTTTPGVSEQSPTVRSDRSPLSGYLPPGFGWPTIGIAVLLVLGGLFLVLRRVRTTGPEGGAVNPQANELVTDSERIRQILEAEGGRASQTDIDEALEWSSSKTSRVLSEMAEAGTIEKLRIGRENIIQLQETDDHD